SSRESEAGTAEYLDDPQRHRSLAQAEIVQILRLQPGMAIAEVGAGQGRLTPAISEAVGPTGHVFAIEPAPEMRVRFRERTQGQGNIHLVAALYHATPIAADSCDRVLMA